MVTVLKAFRWKNLSIIALIIICLKYFVFESLIKNGNYTQFESGFSFLETVLLILSIALIAAGGYVINDINDIESDRINKTDESLLMDYLSEKKALILYGFLTISGIAIGFYIATSYHLYQLAFFHLLSSALLWMYATYFKSSVLIGNLIISLLSAFVPLCYFCFEAYCYIFIYGNIFQEMFHSYFYEGPLLELWWYTLTLAIFAFSFTLIREIVKDLEDLEGDKFLKGKTLPLAIGSSNTLWIVRFLIISVLLLLIYIYYQELQFSPFNLGAFQLYFYGTLILPTLILLFESFKKEVNYHKSSSLLKTIMLFGILSTCVFYLLH